MGGRAKAGDKFMVEVDQFVIGLREPQFEKCKSIVSQGGAEALSETHIHHCDTLVPDVLLLHLLQVAHMIASEIACI
jgi:hypothetical protein